MYFDGTSNATGAGAGAIIMYITGHQFSVLAKLNFSNFNNTAEYEVCILGLELTIEMGIKNMTAYENSELLIKQINGLYKTSDYRLILYFNHVCKLKSQL